MSEALKTALLRAAARILEPLVRLLLETGVGVGEFHSLIKSVYVRVARDTAPEGSGQNISRIAVMTGLTRAEVSSYLKAQESGQPVDEWDRSRSERVLLGWWSDAAFHDRTGLPLALPLRGKRSFATLCEKYSGEPRTVTILDELIRVKAVQKLPDGKFEPISRTVATARWDPVGIASVGEQVRGHLETLAYNLKHPSRPRYTRVVMNAQLDPRFAPMVLRDITQQAETLADAFEDLVNDPAATIKPGRTAQDALRLSVSFHVTEEMIVLEPDKRGPAKRGAKD